MKMESHCHMNGNGPGQRWSNIQSLCVAAKSLGYEALYLGCHDFVCPKDLAKRAEDLYGLKIVRGAEITTDGGHLLAYNIDVIPLEGWADNKNPLEVNRAINLVHQLGGKAVMAHPYPSNKHFSWPNRFAEVVGKLDGAEIANYKSFVRDGVAEFEHVRKWSHLRLFRGSDCHPWEGDRLHPDWHTEIDIEWFGPLV